MGDLLNRRISNVGLSVRTYHALEAGGILTVRDLCSRSEADVSVIRGCGTKTLWELKCFLEENGLSFNKEPYRTINIMVPGDVHYRLDTGDQKFLLLPTLNVPVEVGDYFSIIDKKFLKSKRTFKKQIRYIYSGPGIEEGYTLYGL